MGAAGSVVGAAAGAMAGVVAGVAAKVRRQGRKAGMGSEDETVSTLYSLLIAAASAAGRQGEGRRGYDVTV